MKLSSGFASIRFDIGKYTSEHWQLLPAELEGAEAFREEGQLIEHGVAADLGGWLAVSPEWREFGTVDLDGRPIIRYGEDGQFGIGQWLNIPYQVASPLVGCSEGGYHDKVDISTLDNGLAALKRMKETGNPGQ